MRRRSIDERHMDGLPPTGALTGASDGQQRPAPPRERPWAAALRGVSPGRTGGSRILTPACPSGFWCKWLGELSLPRLSSLKSQEQLV